MRRIKAVFWALAAGVLLLSVWGCENPFSSEETLRFTTILQSNYHYAFEKPTDSVIRDRGNWESLWYQVFPDSQRVLPEVDFSQEMVVVTSRGMIGGGGYTTEIVEIKKRDDITVKVVNKNPRGVIFYDVMTCPTHIVRTKRYDRKVKFEKLYPIF